MIPAELFRQICVVTGAFLTLFSLDESKTDVLSTLLITFTA